MKALVYTAVFGGYDAPKTHVPQSIQVDYVYFNEAHCPYLPAHIRDLHPRLIAKYFKLQPYVMPAYRNYDYVVWIDGSGTLLSPDSLTALISYCKSGYAVFRHPNRDCIYDEADFCKDFEKYRSQPIEQQVDAYRRDGYPPHNGLYACGVIVRDTKKDFTSVDSDWLTENLKWSYQDQLSFPYILWKRGMEVDVIALDLIHNDYVSFIREDWTK